MPESTVVDKYYPLTTLNFEGEQRSRTVGCFPDLESARQCASENWGDIYENGWYPWLVIEEMEWGLYPHSIGKRWFFKWQGDVETGGYVEHNPPDEDEQIAAYFG